jgi:hypothetical protein
MTGYGVIVFIFDVRHLFYIAETFLDNDELQYLLACMMRIYLFGGVRHLSMESYTFFTIQE